MRIISGWARGRRLASPSGRGKKDIRPTADRAREALFSVLAHRILHAKVLDLYAGTGALGLEALSRGAQHVVFVDFSLQALGLIKKNIELCQPIEPGITLQVIRHDLRKGLPERIIPAESSQPYDLIFLDPPYSQGLSLKTLHHLACSNMLADDGLIVAEERATEQLPQQLEQLILRDQRTYGDTGFWLYTPRTHR